MIFIDEAYNLHIDRNNAFGDKTTDSIIDQVEFLREELIVILVG